jgi:hypothetical protein
MTASASHSPQMQRAARLLAALSLAVLLISVGWKVLQPRQDGSSGNAERVLPELRSNLHLPYFSFARALRPRS